MVAALAAIACTRPRTGPRQEVFELPPAFRGLVHIAVDRPECPPLDVRNGVMYFTINSDGSGCTSGAPAVYCGWIKRQFFYRDERHTELHWTTWGGGGMIWGETGIGDLSKGGKQHLCPFHFFVGTESEFKASHETRAIDEGCSPLEFDPKRTPGVIGPCTD
jgi:hypothetical protein